MEIIFLSMFNIIGALMLAIVIVVLFAILGAIFREIYIRIRDDF